MASTFLRFILQEWEFWQLIISIFVMPKGTKIAAAKLSGFSTWTERLAKVSVVFPDEGSVGFLKIASGAGERVLVEGERHPAKAIDSLL